MTNSSKQLFAATMNLMNQKVLEERLKEYQLTKEELEVIHQAAMKRARLRARKPF